MESINLIKKEGRGRSFVILSEAGEYTEMPEALFEVLSQGAKVFYYHTEKITNHNWSELTAALRTKLDQEGTRQTSLVAFGSASSIALNLALLDQKFIRSLVLVDAATRAHPSLLDRVADRIEKFLPLGLPLRSLTPGFNSSPFLQRIRCPVLVVLTKLASSYVIKQAQIFQRSLPTGWLERLAADGEITKLLSLVTDFQQVPAKCPQKASEIQN